jgi:DNA-binding response OmpR family regulator
MSAKAPTVLVVDDDRAVREFVKALLEQNGYVVRHAVDGEAALALLAIQPVDIVLLDILMPRKEGLETLLELKRQLPKVVVIAMSASGMRKGNDFLTIASKFGADSILQKPFSPDDLLARLRSYCAPGTSVNPVSSVGN